MLITYNFPWNALGEGITDCLSLVLQVKMLALGALWCYFHFLNFLFQRTVFSLVHSLLVSSHL